MRDAELAGKREIITDSTAITMKKQPIVILILQPDILIFGTAS
jgi:hypothetical protein